MTISTRSENWTLSLKTGIIWLAETEKKFRIQSFDSMIFFHIMHMGGKY